MRAWPRTKKPREVEPLELVPALASVSQRGKAQLRAHGQLGWSWEETWPPLLAGDADVEALLAFADRHLNRGLSFWIDHRGTAGSVKPINGAGRENLIRDAAMDTDTDADGVVDGFSSITTSGATATFALEGTRGAQEIDGTRGSSSDSVARVLQRVLRVFENDELTLSVDAETEDGTGDAQVQIIIRYWDENDNQVSVNSIIDESDGAFTRKVITRTTPASASYVSVEFRLVIVGGDGDTGKAWFRDARLIRASSDPSAWSNPHVSGASQTGETLATSGWPASTTGVLKAGDFFRIGGSGDTKANAEADEFAPAFKVTADADSDGNGDATVEIVPAIPVGSSPPDGAALRFEKMRMKCWLASRNVPRARRNEYYGGLSYGFRESL